jgi:chitinase
MPFLRVGYYPDWTETAITALPIAGFTHLCHAFALVSTKTGVSSPKDAKNFCTVCKKRNVVPILSLGGAESGSAFATLTRTKKNETVATIANVIRANGYQGLDIDWEAPANAEEGQLLTAFVQAIRTAMGAKFLLTMAVPASNWSGQWFESQALLPLINQLHVMTYDNAGEWSKTADHNAPFAFFQSGLTYWTLEKHWPKEKLLLGLPCYGRGFAVREWGAKVAGKANHPYVAYNEIARLEASGWTRHMDTKAQNPYLRAPDGGELVSFDDPALITKKVQWAEKEKIKGIFFWEITLDFNGKQNELLEASKR